MTPEIASTQVIFVQFENQGGDWAIRIPKAYRDGSDYVAAVSEELSLQFQPVMMSSLMSGDSRNGIACIPLTLEKEKPDDTQTDDKD